MLEKDERKMDGLHSLEVSEEGDYSLCFDNTFSHVSDKTIFMDVMMDSQSGKIYIYIYIYIYIT